MCNTKHYDTNSRAQIQEKNAARTDKCEKGCKACKYTHLFESTVHCVSIPSGCPLVEKVRVSCAASFWGKRPYRSITCDKQKGEPKEEGTWTLSWLSLRFAHKSAKCPSMTWSLVKTHLHISVKGAHLLSGAKRARHHHHHHIMFYIEMIHNEAALYAWYILTH